MTKERWKNIKGFPGCRVSSEGNVTRNGKLLVQTPIVQGYVRVWLTPKIRRYVHRLVAEAFVGPDPSRPGETKYIVDHKDDDPQNNRKNNLQWLTQSENVLKSMQQRGKSRRLLPERRAVLIERIKQNRNSTAEICAEFGVSAPLVRQIRNGRSKEKLQVQPMYGPGRTSARTNHAS